MSQKTKLRIRVKRIRIRKSKKKLLKKLIRTLTIKYQISIFREKLSWYRKWVQFIRKKTRKKWEFSLGSFFI